MAQGSLIWERSGVEVRVGLGDVVRAWGVGVLFLVLVAWTFRLFVSPDFPKEWAVLMVLVQGLLLLRLPRKGLGSAAALAWQRTLGRGSVGFMSMPFYRDCVLDIEDGELVVWQVDGTVGRLLLNKELPVKVLRQSGWNRFQGECYTEIRLDGVLCVELADKGATAAHLVGKPGVEWLGEQRNLDWPSRLKDE